MYVSSQEKRMEDSMKKYQQNGGSLSPAVPELSPKARARHRPPKRVSVVYYLCRNGHLEHPHLIEVPLSSPRGLLLKDFIERLNGLRGKGMPALYSWSCKRSYRSGFVWQDLCANDMICPTNDNEYILKGSELLEGALCPIADRQRQLPQHPPPLAVTKQDDGSSTTSLSSSSPDEGKLPQTPDSSAADASTQTNSALPDVCTRGVSTEEPDPDDADRDESLRRDELVATEPFRVSVLSLSKKNPDKSASFDVLNQNHPSIRITETEPEAAWAEGSKTRVADMLMQLISCGAIAIRNNEHRFVPAYHQRDSPVESRKVDDSSRFVHKSGSSRESNFLNKKPSLLVIGPEQQQAAPRLVLPLERSSNSSERSCKSVVDEEPPEPEKERARLKCIPLTIKCSQSKPTKHSPHEDNDHMQSSDSASDSAGGFRGSPEICKHIVAALPDGKPSKRPEHFMEEQKIVGTEEN